MSYDLDTQTLRIIFISGIIYDYKDVPPYIYENMKAAFSKGTFLNQHIKNHYEFEKIEEL